MATSGALSTSNQYIKYKITITQNSQSITNNTSNVTVSVKFYRTNTGYTTYGSGTVYCKINGTTYSASVDSADKITSSGITLFTKTLNISHASDGTKTLSTSAWISHSQFSASEQSYSMKLTTIPRKSTLSVGNGTLGTTQTLTVTRQSSSFTHTITATCGSSSTTICTKSTSTSIAFTPPIAWSSQNTTGTSVSVKYTITTYNGSTSVGSNSYTKTCSIPSSVKPSCSLTVSDPTGYLSTYGGYVQGLSKFTVSVSASGSYSSSIKSYRTTANGGTYTASSFTTGVITSSGTLSIATTVTDSRSRTATASKSVSVLAYATPKISAFSVVRCNQDGTANSGGSYMKVTFNSSVTSLNSKNKATYTLKYKKSTASSYTTVTLSNYANNYAVSGGSYIFAADTASSYNVTLTLSDNFKTVSHNGTGSTASKTMSLFNEGKGIAFGKIAEKEDFLDVGFQANFNKSVQGMVEGLNALPLIPSNSDLNNYTTPGCYAVNKNAVAATLANIPCNVAGRLIVTSGTGVDASQLKSWTYWRQKFVPHITSMPTYERDIQTADNTNKIYSSWKPTTLCGQKLLWSGNSQMLDTTTIILTEGISEQPNGVVLFFSANNGAWYLHSFFIAKHQISLCADIGGYGYNFLLASGGLLDIVGSKYLYIYNDRITGNKYNSTAGTSTSGIKYNNAAFALRYVIAV